MIKSYCNLNLGCYGKGLFPKLLDPTLFWGCDCFWACQKEPKMECQSPIVYKLTKLIGPMEIGFCQTKTHVGSPVGLKHQPKTFTFVLHWLWNICSDELIWSKLFTPKDNTYFASLYEYINFFELKFTPFTSLLCLWRHKDWFKLHCKSVVTCDRFLLFCREMGNFLSLQHCSLLHRLQWHATSVNEP